MSMGATAANPKQETATECDEGRLGAWAVSCARNASKKQC